MRKTFGKIVGLVLMFVFVTGLVTPISAADQPYMKAARNDLNKAQNALQRATDDKGGHRKSAISLIGRAITEVNAGISYDRKNDTFNEEIFIANETYSAADQPNMQTAKARLQDALNNLQRATADKGGHRAKAIDLVKDAIEQVNKGIEYDRRN